MVPYDKVPDYLKLADAFVTASVTEVHPLTVVEAMAAGLPVLGISSPGICDTIREGESGYLVPQVDMASFTAKMVRLVREDDFRRQMGETARRAAAEYDIELTTVRNGRTLPQGDRAGEEPEAQLADPLCPLDGYDPAMKNARQRLASWGEAYAAAYLQERGYRIIERNARTPYGEIDLVAAEVGGMEQTSPDRPDSQTGDRIRRSQNAPLNQLWIPRTSHHTP